jgi:hypothetical protein
MQCHRNIIVTRIYTHANKQVQRARSKHVQTRARANGKVNAQTNNGHNSMQDSAHMYTQNAAHTFWKQACSQHLILLQELRAMRLTHEVTVHLAANREYYKARTSHQTTPVKQAAKKLRSHDQHKKRRALTSKQSCQSTHSSGMKTHEGRKAQHCARTYMDGRAGLEAWIFEMRTPATD